MPAELARCEEYLDAEWRLLRRKRVILALGKIAWDAALRLCTRQGLAGKVGAQPRAFGHGAMVRLGDGLRLIGSYHVSQQNTFTGKLTAGMFDGVLRACARE
jgi:uracil-DNA glycosylase